MDDSISKFDDVALVELLVFYKDCDICYAYSQWLELGTERKKTKFPENYCARAEDSSCQTLRMIFMICMVTIFYS